MILAFGIQLLFKQLLSEYQIYTDLNSFGLMY